MTPKIHSTLDIQRCLVQENDDKERLYSDDLNNGLVWYSVQGHVSYSWLVRYSEHKHLNSRLKVPNSGHELENKLLVCNLNGSVNPMNGIQIVTVHQIFFKGSYKGIFCFTVSYCDKTFQHMIIVRMVCVASEKSYIQWGSDHQIFE